MNAYLGHLSNCIQGPLAPTAVRSVRDDTQVAGRRVLCHRPERTLAAYLPVGTVSWLRQQTEAQSCAMVESVETYIADRAASELTALYQQHTASPAEFSAALWPVLGYEPKSSPREVQPESRSRD